MSPLVLFAVDVPRTAAFYEVLLNGRTVEEGVCARVTSEIDEVLVHDIPADIAATIKIVSPPVAREDTPMKPVFTVDDVDATIARAEAHGGQTIGRGFTYEGRRYQDVLDPEGNVVQLRGDA